MKWIEKPVSLENREEILRYAALRPVCTVEGHFLCNYIWKDYYHMRYHVEDDFLCLLIDGAGNTPGVVVPFCREENLIRVFFHIEKYFHEELNLPMRMYLVDKYSLGILEGNSCFLEKYQVSGDRDCYDYVYDADKLRTLSGKAYHKKKNHFNSFMRKYENRYSYCSLNKDNSEEILGLYELWQKEHHDNDRYHTIETEKNAIMDILNHQEELQAHVGGIRIDGRLQAFSVGSYDEAIKCAYIHMEKANNEIPELFTVINQQFILHEFPEAKYVNREDDLGQEGLRRAKLSWKPIFLAEKYSIIEKN